MLRTDWRYYIDATEVHPSGDNKAAIRYKHDDGEIFFTQEFNGDLTFTKSDYLIFKTDYDLGDYCKRYEFYIEQKCNGTYYVVFMGFFSLLDGEFDLDRCTFKVKPTIEDKYSCLKLIEDVEINLMTLPKHTITLNQVTSYEFSYYQSAGFFQDSTDLGIFQGTWWEYESAGEILFSVHIYAREVIILKEGETPVGTGWNAPNEICYQILNQVPCSLQTLNYQEPTAGSVKWVRNTSYNPITLLSSDFIMHWDNATYDNDTTLKNVGEIIFYNPLFYTHFYFKKTYMANLYSVYNTIDFINAIKLTDAVNLLVSQCDEIGALQSEFFTNSTNPVTGIASKTNNIFLLQNSDVKRPDASQAATIGKITWKDFISIIQNYFNVKSYIDNDSNIVIEHISTIQKSEGLDITVNPYTKTTSQKRKFKFDKNLISKYEHWNTEKMSNIDFVGTDIFYADDCTKKDGKHDAKNYDLKDVVTDINYILKDPEKTNDEGFVLVACDVNNIIINAQGALTCNVKENGYLSISNLHNEFWKHERIFLNGNMNGLQQTFLSALKLRQLEKLNIIKCCNTEFDPVDTINTELGTANVESATFNLFDNKLELDLYV